MAKMRWKVKDKAPEEFFKENHQYNEIILQLLYNRGIKKKDEIERFLNPDWERDLYDPFLMKGIPEALSRIIKAKKDKEKIGLFGHFDVDGVVSMALINEMFKELGLPVSPYVPARKEGYGLTRSAVHQFHKEKVNLIITVDTGSTSFSEIKLAQRLGMDTIVLDHHQVFEKPEAFAFVNPNQKGCRYPFKELAGVGVVFKLVQAAVSDRGFGFKNKDAFLKWRADLVALGTVCDVMPLLSENRVFSKFGLIVLNKTKRIGLKKLYQKARVSPPYINPYIVSYVIGPRLNAPGRIDHASASFYLLTTSDPFLAENLAVKLENINQERQALLDRLLEEAKKEVEDGGYLNKKLIIVGKQTWPSGLIGLIAGRLKDEYTRPVIALSVGQEESKGSARSIDNFHITEALAECEECLIRFGGHKKAAGFSILTEKIEELKRRLINQAEKRLTDEDITPVLEIDAKINLSSVNWSLWKSLEKFEPTGLGNPAPIFLAENVRVEDVKQVGQQGQHLKLKIYGFDALFFGKGDLTQTLNPSDIIDIVFQVVVDQYNNEQKLALKILDLRKK